MPLLALLIPASIKSKKQQQIIDNKNQQTYRKPFSLFKWYSTRTAHSSTSQHKKWVDKIFD